MSNDELTPLLVTVFTPTYNRAHTLPDLYESLYKQTDMNFEWLVIDDGSEDKTAELVHAWMSNSRFPIRYCYQENSGKHIAYNWALTLAQGQLFWPIDSDDLAVPISIERIRYHWQKVQEEHSKAKAISFLLYTANGGRLNEDYSQPIFEARLPQLIYQGIIKHDVWVVFEINSARLCSFSEQYHRIYVPERTILYAFSAAHLTRFINERLGIYRHNSVDTSRMSNFSRLEQLKTGGAISLFLQHWSQLNFGRRYLWRYLKFHSLSAIHFHRFAGLAGIGLRDRLRRITDPTMRYFVAIFWPLGWLAARLTLIKYHRAMSQVKKI